MLNLDNSPPSKKQKTNVGKPGGTGTADTGENAEEDGKANEDGKEESKKSKADEEFGIIAEYERLADKEWKESQLKAIKRSREAI